MNKPCKTVALGLLAVSLIPCVANAQLVKGAKETRHFLGFGGKRSAEIAALRQNLEKTVRVLGIPVYKYKTRPGVEWVDFNSRQDRRELNKMFPYVDLSNITPIGIARKALSYGVLPPEQAEKWVLFALNNGANPSEVLNYAVFVNSDFVLNGNKKKAARVLIRDYGLNPDGKMPNGYPIVYDLITHQGLAEADMDYFDLNVDVNGEPLIFSVIDLDGEVFGKIFKRITPWTTLNKRGANPLHAAANAFNLAQVMPEGYKIPEEYRNAVDNDKNTYLQYALQGPYADVNVPWLIEQGVNPNISNRFGDSPTNIINQRLKSLGQ